MAHECVVKNSYFPNKLIRGLNEQRNDSRHCDVTVVVGEEMFPAHKAVLCAASKYFDTMFSSSFIEAISSEVKIDGNGDAFRRLLDFAYSGELRLTLEVYMDVLELAGYLQISHALKLCASGLTKLSRDGGVCMDVALRAGVFAIKYEVDCEDLERVANDLLIPHFDELLKTEAFLTDLTCEHLKHLLCRDDLMVLSEDLCEDKVSLEPGEETLIGKGHSYLVRPYRDVLPILSGLLRRPNLTVKPF